MKALAAEYRNLGAQEKDELTAIGNEARALHAHGLPSFVMNSD